MCTVKPPQPSWVAHLVLPPASVARALAQVAPGGRYPLRYAHSKSYLYDAHLILPPAGGVARALPHVAPRGAARGPGAARPGLRIRECRARLFRRRPRQPPQLGGVVCDLAVCDLAELEARCRAGCRAGTGAIFCRRRVGYVFQAGGGGREGGGVGQRPRLGAGAVPQRRQALGDALRCKSHDSIEAAGECRTTCNQGQGLGGKSYELYSNTSRVAECEGTCGMLRVRGSCCGSGVVSSGGTAVSSAAAPASRASRARHAALCTILMFGPNSSGQRR